MNMSISNRCSRNQCSKHNCCHHHERKPYPPVGPTGPTGPTGPHVVTIPIIPLNILPDPNRVPQGALVLIGDPLPKEMDHDNMPNPLDYYFAVANGCYYMGFSPSMLGCSSGAGATGPVFG